MSHQSECETMLPCPFCGGPPCAVVMNVRVCRALRAEDWDGQAANGGPAYDHGLSLSGHVFCHECGSQGPYAEHVSAFPEDVEQLKRDGMRLWNERDARHLEMYVASVRGLVSDE